MPGTIFIEERRRTIHALAATVVLGLISVCGPVLAVADSFSNRQAILAEIEKQPGFGPYEMEVYSRGDLIVLDGRVASERSKALAEKIASKHSDNIVNNLVVDPAKMKALEANGNQQAAHLAQSVRDAVMARSDLSGYELNVRVRGETATLEGIAPNVETKTAIQEIAQRTAGIKNVSNQLVIGRSSVPRASSAVSDREIAERVMAAYRGNPEIDSQGLSVAVQGGVVTVRGLRSDHRDRDRILSVTLNVPGVRDIRSELR